MLNPTEMKSSKISHCAIRADAVINYMQGMYVCCIFCPVISGMELEIRKIMIVCVVKWCDGIGAQHMKYSINARFQQ